MFNDILKILPTWFQLVVLTSKRQVIFALMQRVLKLIVFLMCIRVAIGFAANDLKIIQSFSILVFLFLIFVFVSKMHEKAKQPSPIFSQKAKFYGLITADYPKLHSAMTSFFVHGLFCLLAIMAFVFLAGNFTIPILMAAALLAAIGPFLVFKLQLEIIAFGGFLLLFFFCFAFSYFFGFVIDSVINSALLFFLFRAFQFEYLKMLKAFFRVTELYENNFFSLENAVADD